MNDLPNFDPIAVADEIAALETEAQDELAEAKDEFDCHLTPDEFGR